MKKPRTYYLLNLGCPKNEIDGHSLEYLLIKRGLSASEPEDADILIVNTCGFIEAAKRESIHEILRLAQFKSRDNILAITGCLSQWYREELANEFPEADYIFGISSREAVTDMLISGAGENIDCTFEIGETYEPDTGRIIPETPYAYIKIADGCDNRCSYCAIPFIRGSYRSRSPDDILSEVDYLLSNGIKELILVAQETTRYGKDLRGNISLETLIAEITSDDRLKWLRLLYAHPARTTQSLLEKIAGDAKICSYLDIPLQHISDNMLKRMNRNVTSSDIESLIYGIRNDFPDIALRTTILLGHPGETEDDFLGLMDFIEKTRFENLGCFVYSEEEQTASAEMGHRVPEETAYERYDRLMMLQSEIAEENNRQLCGRTYNTIVDEFDEENEIYYCRLESQAPEIDGHVELSFHENELNRGDFVNIKINGYDLYDLKAVPADNTGSGKVG